MTTGRINQVTSPYMVNKRRVQKIEGRFLKHTSRSNLKHPCFKLDFVHSVWGLKLTRSLKLTLTFQTKCRRPWNHAHWRARKVGRRRILVVYLNRSLAAEITENQTTQLWIHPRHGLRSAGGWGLLRRNYGAGSESRCAFSKKSSHDRSPAVVLIYTDAHRVPT